MNLLDKIGKAVRDTIYEAFFDFTETLDLEDLRGKGYSVHEYRLSVDGMDKLYVLVLDYKIQMGATLIINRAEENPIVSILNGKEVMDVLGYVKSAR